MPVGLPDELPPLLPVDGVRWGVAAAGIRYKKRYDLALMEIAPGAKIAAVYTRNAFCAAPVVVARRHGGVVAARYLLINSGNANAGTGEAGMAAALQSCQAVAELAGCKAEEVLPFSTGVIGELLPVDRLKAGLPAAFDTLSADNWNAAARAIMTTDIVSKGVSRQVQVKGNTVTVSGIAKGSGMIHPDMATMLSYVATDAEVEQALLQQLLQQAMQKSFNSITVDGDTSTNDACVLVATGKASVVFESESDEGFGEFVAAVVEVCQLLAQAIVRDGEGATKFITLNVEQGRDEAECRQVAFTIAHSPLVKTAFFASDPNWGRILAAVGRASLDNLDLDRVVIRMGDVCIVRNGGLDSDYTEKAGQAVMKQDEISINVVLGRGDASATVWTCDFSYDYVKINAEYRS
jgi:glutamate N-acetyltransferase/amino-acid N-acetyltransferase